MYKKNIATKGLISLSIVSLFLDIHLDLDLYQQLYVFSLLYVKLSNLS